MEVGGREETDCTSAACGKDQHQHPDQPRLGRARRETPGCAQNVFCPLQPQGRASSKGSLEGIRVLGFLDVQGILWVVEATGLRGPRGSSSVVGVVGPHSAHFTARPWLARAMPLAGRRGGAAAAGKAAAGGGRGKGRGRGRGKGRGKGSIAAWVVPAEAAPAEAADASDEREELEASLEQLLDDGDTPLPPTPQEGDADGLADPSVAPQTPPERAEDRRGVDDAQSGQEAGEARWQPLFDWLERKIEEEANT